MGVDVGVGTVYFRMLLYLAYINSYIIVKSINALIVFTAGSFLCFCSPGYRGDGSPLVMVSKPVRRKFPKLYISSQALLFFFNSAHRNSKTGPVAIAIFLCVDKKWESLLIRLLFLFQI